MVYYTLVKITINTFGLAKVIINTLIYHHSLSNSIVNDRESVFISKFWLLLSSFFGIKYRFSTPFYLQTDNQIQRQNSIIDVYLWAFVNFEQDDCAYFLLMAKFPYKNIKNASTSHTLFDLNCRCHPCISYEKDIDLWFKSKTVDKLLAKLWKLMFVYCNNFFHA